MKKKYETMTMGRMRNILERQKYKDLFDGDKSVYAVSISFYFGEEFGRIDDTRTLTREDLENILSFKRKNMIELENIVVIHDGYAKLGSYFREAADSDIECVWSGRTRRDYYTKEREYEILDGNGSWSWVKGFKIK